MPDERAIVTKTGCNYVAKWTRMSIPQRIRAPLALKVLGATRVGKVVTEWDDAGGHWWTLPYTAPNEYTIEQIEAMLDEPYIKLFSDLQARVSNIENTLKSLKSISSMRLRDIFRRRR